MLCLCCIFHHKDHKGYSVLWCGILFVMVCDVCCIKTSGCLQSKDSLLSSRCWVDAY